MSHLAATLRNLLDKHNLKQTKVGRSARVPDATISRVFSGKTIKTRYLDQIMDVLAKTQQDKLDVIVSRLRDAYDGKYKQLIESTLANAASEPPQITVPLCLDRETTEAVQCLAQRVPRNKVIGELLINLKNLVESNQAPTRRTISQTAARPTL